MFFLIKKDILKLVFCIKMMLKMGKKEDGTVSPVSLRELAKMLYVEHGKSQAEISRQLGVDKSLLSKWVYNGGWAEEKAAYQVTSAVLIKKIYGAMNVILDKEAITEKDIASINKLTNTIKTLDRSLDLTALMDISEEFVKYLIGDGDETFAKQFAEKFRPFIVKKGKQIAS